MKYDHKKIEAVWQKKWQETTLHSVDIQHARKPFFNLMMFPYPSAEGLHVGNMYAFTGADIFGRYMRMQGYDVFEPIGLDGFGIHSENYALKVGRHPADQAKRSQENFYRQLRMIGCMYDWERTVETYDPSYYRWTQWLFVQMFKHGLAYRAKAEVNWCPSCKTVLADEQVIDEKCERCGKNIEKRALEQWFFRITAYAGKLLENISNLPTQAGLNWTEKVLTAQRYWIGEKEGINITYPVVTADGKSVGELVCFTTRPDTNYGATFVVIAPEHPFVTLIQKVLKTEQVDTILQYVKKAGAVSAQERIAQKRKKSGVSTGLFAINKLTGYKMPVYISDFVVMNVGTGAVVGVPGHDVRDFEFATAMGIPIVRVVAGPDGNTSKIVRVEQVQEDDGIMVNSGFLDGMSMRTAIGAMTDYLEKMGWGKRVTTYHLRDWLISRQRYWGPPIPMIYCEKCAKEGKSWFTTHSVIPASGPESSAQAKRARDDNCMAGWYPVPDDQLPVVLPRIEDYTPGTDGIAPLAKHQEFYETVCPGCGKKAVRETDVSDTFLDSSWYFLRYPSVGSAHSGQAPFDSEITKKWLPVDMYTGGAEHSVLHLMYSRFVWMCLYDWGYFDCSAQGGPAPGWEEPFPNFYAHGLVIKDGAKMSKSKGNVVNPDEYINLYGTDALRMYLMFMGPFSEGGDFRDTAMEGMSRWLCRVWRMAMRSLESGTQIGNTDNYIKAVHRLVKYVGDDTKRRRYNTAISKMMEFTNFVSAANGILPLEILKTFILVLAPYAPHMTEELWSRAGGTYSVHQQAWPVYDSRYLKDNTVTIAVQINGKLRDTIVMNAHEAQDKKNMEIRALQSEKVQKYLKDSMARKIIIVPEKLINIVV